MKRELMLRPTISLILLAFMACSHPKEQNKIPLPFYNQADFTPEWIAEKDPAYEDIHTVSNFQLVNQNGEIVTNKTLRGHIYVANFFFTVCPSICPKMTANMEIIHHEFGEDPKVLLLSHTVMPWVDSVKVLKEYAIAKGLDSERWHFVTGTKEKIYSLARYSYFAEKAMGIAKDTNEFLHTENFVLVDERGRIRGIYNGTLTLEAKRLIADIKTLKELG